MIQAVLDTNALASSAIAVSGPLALIVDAWERKRIQVVVSWHILGELERALNKPYFQTRLED